MPHESVLELDILTGAGEIVRAAPDEHADLFRAFPNSYGSLGYAVRLRIELEPVTPFVALTHVRFHALDDLVAAMDRIVETGTYDGVRVDYLDGVVFSADMDANAYAFDAADGKVLWQTRLDGAAGGGVISYGVDGTQYVAFVAGTNSPIWPVDRKTAKIVVFAVER